jgi:hypothetical protein
MREEVAVMLGRGTTLKAFNTTYIEASHATTAGYLVYFQPSALRETSSQTMNKSLVKFEFFVGHAKGGELPSTVTERLTRVYRS